MVELGSLHGRGHFSVGQLDHAGIAPVSAFVEPVSSGRLDTLAGK
jgi:hypothetical protein